MPRFFIETSAITETGGKKLAHIVGSDAAHIVKSLRMRVGESVTVCDTECREYDCRIVSADADAVAAEILSERVSLSEPPYKAVIYQCLPKSDKLESIVMKAVECGAYAVVPVLSERCVSRPDGASADKKLARLNKIAAEAAGQCGRAILPRVRDIKSFSDAVSEASLATLPLFFYEDTQGEQSLREVFESAVKQNQTSAGKQKNVSSEAAENSDVVREQFTVSLFIGPEGGFSVKEAQTAKDAGMIHCSLGRRILRTETVATHVLACLSLYFEL